MIGSSAHLSARGLAVKWYVYVIRDWPGATSS